MKCGHHNPRIFSFSCISRYNHQLSQFSALCFFLNLLCGDEDEAFGSSHITSLSDSLVFFGTRFTLGECPFDNFSVDSSVLATSFAFCAHSGCVDQCLMANQLGHTVSKPCIPSQCI